MVTLIAVLVALSFVLFFLQLGEAVWSKVDVADIVRHERTYGASAATRCAKTILDRKPVVVNYFLLAVFMLMYFGPFELGAMMEHEEEGCMAWWVLHVYPFAMFFLAEMIPKMLGMKHALWWALKTAVPLFAIKRGLFPLTWLFGRILKALGGYDDSVGEADVAATAHAAVDDHSLHPMEAEVIQLLLTVGNLTVGQLMVPLARCVKVATPTRRADILPAVRDLKHGTPIIVRTAGGGIAGQMTAETLLELCVRFKNGEPLSLLPYVHGTVDVQQSTPLGDVLSLLRGDRVIRVTDRKGQPLGILTLDQVVSHVFRSQSV